MAFKSKAQRAKFESLRDAGKIKQELLDAWEAGTPAKIPERVVKVKKVGILGPKSKRK